MSWLFSRALVEEFSAATSSAGAASALSSGTPTPRAFLPPDRMTDFSRPSRFGMTFGPLTDALGAELLTWFREASRARTSALPATVQASTASDPACGPKWRGSLAKFDPATSSWKTAQPSLLGDSDEFAETWPRWGTTVAGVLYLQPTPGHLTGASASGLWQTPVADDAVERTAGKWNSRGEPKLSAEVKLWPTPRAQDAKHGAETEWELQTNHAGTRDSLRVQIVKRAMPTPTACMSKGSSQNALKRKTGQSRENDRLDHWVMARDGGSLNPTWVEWLMGWPLGWTDLQPLATAKSLNAPPLRGAA